DLRVGTIAAALLVLNPLYRLHAHRSMSDVPCEALCLTALALGLWTWKRVWSGRSGVLALLLPSLAGVSVGLALLCKFNALLALPTIGVWARIAVFPPALRGRRKLAIARGSIVTAAVAAWTLVAWNPFMTARPSEPMPNEARELASQSPGQRFVFQVRHRL